jgi:hypothetical protein
MSNIANGWTFQQGDGATPTEAFTQIPNVTRANPGAQTSPDIDVTHLLSTTRENKPGLAQPADFQAETIYTPDNTIHNALRALAPSATYKNYRLMDPTNTFGFQYSLAIATFVTQNFEVDGSLRNVITFKQQGNPTLIGDA